MLIQFKNFAHSQLAVGLGVGDTSLTVTGGHGARFPTLSAGQYFYLTLENAALAREIVKVTARATDTFTVVRAQDGTTALAWNAADAVSLRFNAAAITEVVGTLTSGDVVSNTPAGNIAATTVQAAINELDTEKLASSGVSAFMATVLDDANAEAARATLGAAASGANSDITSLTALAIVSKIQPITATVAANALTITLSPTILDFRSATLTSGTVNTRTVAAAISLVISSGSTLGTVSAQQSRIAVLAIDNAGTVELAAVNVAGGNALSETGVISTTAEGGAGAADSASTIYSTTARSNVPYRVVGYVESTQATAGTWATAPSTIQGYGGQAMAAMSSLGYGQTWQVVTGSRAFNTTYYNTTGKPITVYAQGMCSTAEISGGYVVVSGVILGPTASASMGQWGVTFIVPAGQSYSVGINSGTPTVESWVELR